MIELPPKLDLWLPPRPAIIRQADRELLKLARRDAIKASRREASFLPGMQGVVGMMAVARTPSSISYVGAVTNTTDGTTFTFTSASVGAAAAGRKVIIGCVIRGVATNLTATYAGNAMTQLAFVDATNASLALFAIDESVATTATIVVTGSGTSMASAKISIWNGFNCAATPYAVGSNIVGAVVSTNYVFTSSNMSCPFGTVVAAVGCYVDGLVASANSTWGVLTERNDGLIEGNPAVVGAADTTLAGGNPTLVPTFSAPISAGFNGGGLLAVCL